MFNSPKKVTHSKPVSIGFGSVKGKAPRIPAQPAAPKPYKPAKVSGVGAGCAFGCPGAKRGK